MGFFDMFKGREKVEVLKDNHEQKVNKKNIEDRYRIRISNLTEEFEKLSRQLRSTELDLDVTKVEKVKLSDRLIRRMTLLKNEIDIREGLLKWL